MPVMDNEWFCSTCMGVGGLCPEQKKPLADGLGCALHSEHWRDLCPHSVEDGHGTYRGSQHSSHPLLQQHQLSIAQSPKSSSGEHRTPNSLQPHGYPVWGVGVRDITQQWSERSWEEP